MRKVNYSEWREQCALELMYSSHNALVFITPHASDWDVSHTKVESFNQIFTHFLLEYSCHHW